ncbi:MAG: hypothetical protein IJU64_03495 [Bacilli bacterium]|nr:hypothetical protein [Bacilli bacterium]
MKTKQSLLLLLSCFGLSASLASCGNNGPTIRSVSLVTVDDKGEAKRTGDGFHLLFKKDSEIPYVSIEEGFAFLNAIKAARINDAKNEKYYFHLKKEGETYVAVDEADNKVTFDVANQTITYTDFDNFLSFQANNYKPLNLIGIQPTAKSLKFVSSNFKKGQAVTVDLKPYASIDLYTHEGKGYLPLDTFNDLFYNVFENANLAYNYKDVYWIPNESLTVTLFGTTMLSSFGEAFYNVPQRKTLSEEIINFNLQELSLNFDNFYGLKKNKNLASFASFVEEKGFKGDFTSSDPYVVDSSLRLALTHLNDGHTGLSIQSFFIPWGEAKEDDSRYNPTQKKWELDGNQFQKSRKGSASPLGNHFDTTSGTYTIAFDSFHEINENTLYGREELPDGASIDSDTAYQFAMAYDYLSSAEAKTSVKQVVVDLSTNDGGSADSLMYALCTILGKVTTHTKNPVSGAENETVFAADLNRDGQIDDADKGLVEMGYRVGVLSSEYTFSCGNALPAIAKDNNPNIITAGEKSGGGACVLRTSMDPIGQTYTLSGLTQICSKKGDQLVDVDGGVTADVAIAKDSMFDPTKVGTLIGAYKK